MGKRVSGSTFTDLDGDGFLTPAEMAGHPQGLDVIVEPPPKRITIETTEGAIAFLTGAVQFLWNRPNFVESLERKARLLGDYTGLTQEQQEAIVTNFGNGATFYSWIYGKWELGPGIPHPRGLVWCEFITSWEITLLLGLNLCEPGEVASARTMCPQSCNCEAGMKDCPSSCPNVHRMGSANP
mmetsp:Transcript_65424/g.151819  ORF Transcript_65424/g.151819 Transcript_65424/m.151819 type:complete len:183 (-) Transcript_65424:17-565(-)